MGGINFSFIPLTLKLIFLITDLLLHILFPLTGKIVYTKEGKIEKSQFFLYFFSHIFFWMKINLFFTTLQIY